MKTLGIWDTFQVKTQTIKTSIEVKIIFYILECSNVIKNR